MESLGAKFKFMSLVAKVLAFGEIIIRQLYGRVVFHPVA